ncbi:MAG: T9SS type A sorting domain-containing protein [Flavobacteriales bacterium]|nr:T9SS type A sorting domain-containing protein [Flavobacteriales bacterium]
MKKCLLSLATLVFAGSLVAQNCMPQHNSNATQLGFDPNPINGSIAGQAYDEVITIVLPRKVYAGPPINDSITLCKIGIVSFSNDTLDALGYQYEVWAKTLGSSPVDYNVLALSTDTIPVNPNTNLTRACLRLKHSNPPAPQSGDIDSIPLNITVAAWSDLGFGCIDLSGTGGTEDFIVKLPVKAAFYAGINENEIDNSVFSIYNNYPNPAADFTNINFTTPIAGKVNLTVVDALGRLVYQQNITSKSGLNTISVNTSSLRNGIYLYTVEYNGKSITRKLVVNK